MPDPPSDQPAQGSEEPARLPLGSLATAGQPLPHPGPCLECPLGRVLLALRAGPHLPAGARAWEPAGSSSRVGGSLGRGRLVLAPVQHSALPPSPLSGRFAIQCHNQLVLFGGKGRGSGQPGAQALVGREAKRAASVAPRVCAWGPAHVSKHVAAPEAQTRTWAHRPAQVCAVMRVSGRVHACVCPSRHHRAHVPDGDPGLQSSCLAARGPRPGAGTPPTGPLKGRGRPRGPGASTWAPTPGSASLWGGPSQGRVPGVPRGSSPVLLHAEGPPLLQVSGLGVPGGGGGLLQGPGVGLITGSRPETPPDASPE